MAEASKPEESQVCTTTVTLTHIPFTYFHLTLITALDNNAEVSLDMIMVRTYLTSALQQYLGLSGTAVPIDIVKIEGRDAWIRLPREDGSSVQGALSQWVGKDGNVSWRVNAHGGFASILRHGDGRDLFE